MDDQSNSQIKEKCDEVALGIGYGIFLGLFLASTIHVCNCLLRYWISDNRAHGMHFVALGLGLPIMAIQGAIVGAFLGSIYALSPKSPPPPGTSHHHSIRLALAIAAMILIFYAAMFLLSFLPG